MSNLAELLAGILPGTSFRTSQGTVYSPDELREALTRFHWSSPDDSDIFSAQAEAYDDFQGLTEHLRYQLKDHIDPDTDRIGHSFEIAGSYNRSLKLSADLTFQFRAISSLEAFARALVRAAAVLGPDNAASLVEKWAAGEPRHHKLCMILAGVFIDDEDIVLEEGLRIYRLPVSSDLLPLSMPNIREEIVGDMLGHPLMELDVLTQPEFFVPTPSEGEEVTLHTRTPLGESSLETFFLSFSLVCNRRVGSAWSWNDDLDASAFRAQRNSGLASSTTMKVRMLSGLSHDLLSGITELEPPDLPAPNMSEFDVRKAWELRGELQRLMNGDQRFNTAVTRWAKAVSPEASDADRAIDLRIALEALYIDSNQGEVGFRLSLTGARHLATNLDEREDVRKSLNDFYGLASRVIHGTSPTKSKDIRLVDKAATLCRDGILKIVEHRNRPNWTEFLLS